MALQLEASLAGKRFAELRVDVVARPEEITGVEQRSLPDVLGFAGIPARTVAVTDLRQQFAEKLHAMTRDYATGHTTRVKDLIDLLLLVHDGVPADAGLCCAVRHVFRIPGTHAVPGELAAPSPSWQAQFTRYAGEVGLDGIAVESAHSEVSTHWRRALELEAKER